MTTKTIDNGAGVDYAVEFAAGPVTADTQRIHLTDDSPGVLGIGGTSDAAATAGSTGSLSAKLRLATSQLDAIKTAAEILDNAISGNEMQVDVVAALPAGTSLLGSISAKHATDAIMDGVTALTPKFASIAVSSSGDNTLVAAVVGKKIRVLSYTLVAAGAVTCRFEDGAGGTAKSGQMSFAANGGVSVPFSPVGHFETTANTLLNLELGGAVAVAGHLTYVEV